MDVDSFLMSYEDEIDTSAVILETPGDHVDSIPITDPTAQLNDSSIEQAQIQSPVFSKEDYNMIQDLDTDAIPARNVVTMVLRDDIPFVSRRILTTVAHQLSLLSLGNATERTHSEDTSLLASATANGLKEPQSTTSKLPTYDDIDVHAPDFSVKFHVVSKSSFIKRQNDKRKGHVATPLTTPQDNFNSGLYFDTCDTFLIHRKGRRLFKYQSIATQVLKTAGGTTGTNNTDQELEKNNDGDETKPSDGNNYEALVKAPAQPSQDEQKPYYSNQTTAYLMPSNGGLIRPGVDHTDINSLIESGESEQGIIDWYDSSVTGYPLGHILLHSTVTQSTHTIMTTTLSSLPTMVLYLCDSQSLGRGRGGNTWVSPPGCLMFNASFKVMNPTLLPMVQYFYSWAIVQGILHSLEYLCECELCKNVRQEQYNSANPYKNVDNGISAAHSSSDSSSLNNTSSESTSTAQQTHTSKGDSDSDDDNDDDDDDSDDAFDSAKSRKYRFAPPPKKDLPRPPSPSPSPEITSEGSSSDKSTSNHDPEHPQPPNTASSLSTSEATPSFKPCMKKINIQIKWPNDIYVDGQKIAGILCSSLCDITNEGSRFTAHVGTGINVTYSGGYNTINKAILESYSRQLKEHFASRQAQPAEVGAGTSIDPEYSDMPPELIDEEELLLHDAISMANSPDNGGAPSSSKKDDEDKAKTKEVDPDADIDLIAMKLRQHNPSVTPQETPTSLSVINSLPLLSREVLFAAITHFLSLGLPQFNCFGFAPFEQFYYQYWMHMGAQVSIQSDESAVEPSKYQITGLSPGGYLLAKNIADPCHVVELHPDSHRFDMDALAIRPKPH